MNRVCSLIVAVALMSSVLMAQTSPNVPRGHWVYDVFTELEEAGVVSKLSGADAKSEYTRKQGADIVIEAMDSIRKKLEAQPELPKPSFSEIVLASRPERERYQNLLASATELSRPAWSVLRLSVEFQNELTARSVDASAIQKFCNDIEKAEINLERALALISFSQKMAEVPQDHWAYNAVQNMTADGLILGYQIVGNGEHRYYTRNKFARMIMSVPAVLKSRVMEHEAAVNLWCAEKSINNPDDETEARLVSECAMLRQYNVTLVALCFEFSDELKAQNFDPSSIKKTAVDTQFRLTQTEKAMNSARYTAQHPKTAPPTMVIPEWVVPNPNIPLVSGWRLPPSRDDFDQF